MEEVDQSINPIRIVQINSGAIFVLFSDDSEKPKDVTGFITSTDTTVDERNAMCRALYRASGREPETIEDPSIFSTDYQVFTWNHRIFTNLDCSVIVGFHDIIRSESYKGALRTMPIFGLTEAKNVTMSKSAENGFWYAFCGQDVYIATDTALEIRWDGIQYVFTNCSAEKEDIPKPEQGHIMFVVSRTFRRKYDDIAPQVSIGMHDQIKLIEDTIKPPSNLKKANHRHAWVYCTDRSILALHEFYRTQKVPQDLCNAHPLLVDYQNFVHKKPPATEMAAIFRMVHHLDMYGRK